MSIEELDSLARWRCFLGLFIGEGFEEGGVESMVYRRAWKRRQRDRGWTRRRRICMNMGRRTGKE
jgi:hypothetical protein